MQLKSLKKAMFGYKKEYEARQASQRMTAKTLPSMTDFGRAQSGR